MSEDMTYEPVQTVAQLAARVQELEEQQARAIKLLDTCLDFFGTLDNDNWPPALDFAIRQYKGMLAGKPEETPEQMLNRFLNTNRAQQPADDTDAPLTLAAIDDEDGDE